MSYDEKARPQPRAPDPATERMPGQRDLDALARLVGQHKHAEAEALARDMVTRHPEHGFAWKGLGVSLKAQGRLPEACEALQQAVSHTPNDANAHYQLGLARMAREQAAAAAEGFRRAIALKPDYVQAHLGLGNALGAQEQLAGAAASYRQALALQPDFIEAHACLGFALLALDAANDAEIHFRRVLETRPDDARINNSLGVVYRGQGRLAEAEACYRRALARLPDYAEAHSNLGNVLRDLGRCDEAEVCYRRALAIRDDIAEPHFNLGNIQRARGCQQDAERSYRRALEIDPHHLMALNNLGLCLKKQGRLDEAVRSFQTAIALKPDFIQSHCNLSPFKTYAADDPDLALLERQREHLDDLPTAGRISYWFALGKMREDAGRYDDAFAAYAEGNRLQHAQFPSDEAHGAALFARLQAIFDEAFFAARPRPAHPGRAPIFIVGMPRSGTSLIEQILSTHPGVHGAGELTDLDAVVRSIGTASGRAGDAYPELARGLSTDDFRRLGEAYAERVWKLAPEAERITDKLPANFLHIGLIHLMLPHAKIIHAMRDPMDSCFSCYSRLFEGNNLDFSYDLGSVGRYYVRYIELMRHWQRVLPRGTLLDLRYEDMVADTEGQARRLLDYLELPWDERCLDFHRNRRVVKTASVAQVRRPIYRSSVARWKHFEAHLGPLLDIVQPYR